MRHCKLLAAMLPLAIIFSLTLGCLSQQESDDSTAQEQAKEHPAMTVANQVLAAITAGDVAAIRPLLNSNNKDLSDEDVTGYMQQDGKEAMGDVRTVSELRQGRSENEVVAKIRVKGEEVYVVTLTLEEGNYRFEDINSPSVEDYEALTKIEP